MNINVIKDHIPFPSANNINALKHAEGFYSSGHNVEILTIEKYIESKYGSIEFMLGDLTKMPF